MIRREFFDAALRAAQALDNNPIDTTAFHALHNPIDTTAFHALHNPIDTTAFHALHNPIDTTAFHALHNPIDTTAFHALHNPIDTTAFHALHNPIDTTAFHALHNPIDTTAFHALHNPIDTTAFHALHNPIDTTAFHALHNPIDTTAFHALHNPIDTTAFHALHNPIDTTAFHALHNPIDRPRAGAELENPGPTQPPTDLEDAPDSVLEFKTAQLLVELATWSDLLAQLDLLRHTDVGISDSWLLAVAKQIDGCLRGLVVTGSNGACWRCGDATLTPSGVTCGECAALVARLVLEVWHLAEGLEPS